MAFRVTSSYLSHQAQRATARHNSNIARLQEQLTSGLRINRPSDDPIDARLLLSYRSDVLRLDAEQSNIRDARVALNTSVSALLEAKNLLVSAKSLALESPVNFETGVLGDQVDRILERLEQVANSQLDGKYLFSGTSINTRPFARSADGSGETIYYQGAKQNSAIVVGLGIVVESNHRGDEIFFGVDRGETVFAGETGVISGTGSNSSIGRQTLSVSHTNTTILGGSGISNGTSSATLDTIIGDVGRHQLTVIDTAGDGSAGTVSLNGGPPVQFTNADADLKVIGPQGEAVYVNTTSIAAGFNGVVDLSAGGTLSLDGGQTTVAIDFSANQVVSDEQGGVTHVDTREIRAAGTESVNHSGTVDAFQLLKQLASDFRNNENLSESARQTLISQAIGDLDRHMSQVLSVVGEQSSSLENLDSIEIRNQDVQLETQRVIADIESADISEVAIQLQTEQNLLQFTYAATSQIFGASLLDFI